MGVEVETNVDFFRLVVAPDEAAAWISVIIKEELNDEHRIVIIVVNEEVVNARLPVFNTPERELY